MRVKSYNPRVYFLEKRINHTHLKWTPPTLEDNLPKFMLLVFHQANAFLKETWSLQAPWPQWPTYPHPQTCVQKMYLALLPFPRRPVIQTIPFLPGKNLVHNTPHNLSARTRSHKAWQLKSTPETKLFICHKNYLLRNIPPIPSKPLWFLALPQNILFLNRVDRSLHPCPYHDPWREPNYLLTGKAINWEQVELKTPLWIHSEIQKK